MAYPKEDIIKELQKFSTIAERLDFFKNSKEKYSNLFVDSTEEATTSLQIPIDIYKLFFEHEENTIEFTYWFLQYNASLILENIKKEKYIIQKLESPLRDKILKGELKKIQDIEDGAEQLLENGFVDIYAEQIDSNYIREIEYLRIKADYYKSNFLPSIDLDPEVVHVYATHIYLKDFLEKELQQFTGNILDVIALEKLEKEEKPIAVVQDNENFVGFHGDHGLPPFRKPREQGLPIFEKSSIISLGDILKPYFSEKDFYYLETLLETASPLPNKIFFLSEGNKLADVFWQLYENKLVFNCNKMQLEQWIASNFQYLERGNAKDFTLKYLNKIISTDHQTCKNPILGIYNDLSSNKKLLKVT
ncbi:hypothetical protein [Aquimarina sp. MMG016]|uniref:hypothetical protein n=1 Tax=Aquimarina sp. MMG016 TaxID=2822690 RepID=UPI001B39D8EF|nr:hypothetical protein [Aquimarina sp. MMG016]MBQ4820578.1 hypothetical protein [Aquimarina sp. MMG016]